MSQPFRIFALQLQHRWNRYRVMMVSDDRARTYLLVEDDTTALLGGLVVPFVSQLCDYLRREGSPRPDVSLLRRRLRLASSHELHLDHVRDSADNRRAGGLQLVEDLQTLVHFADRDRLVQSSASEQRRSAARRREFARRLHEDVVQDLVALRWSTAADDATQTVYNRVLMTVRTILAELRVPPWEQRLRDVLAPVLQTVRNSGVSVSLHVDLPEPVPFELTSVVAVVTKEALTNAMKHARPDEVVVDLRIVGARQLLLTVSDDGTGTSTAAAGTGYGVSMCVELAEEYGGSFALTREAGGHVARLLMPLEIVPDESDSTSGGQPSTINSS